MGASGIGQIPHALANGTGGAKGGSEVPGRDARNDGGGTGGIGRGIGVERSGRGPGRRAGERGARRLTERQGGHEGGVRRAGGQADGREPRGIGIPSGVSLEEISSSAPRERSEDRFEGGRERRAGIATRAERSRAHSRERAKSDDTSQQVWELRRELRQLREGVLRGAAEPGPVWANPFSA